MANSHKPGQEVDNYWSASTAADHREEFQPIQWLWPGHIPRGSVTALIAVPGSSKSTLAHQLCHTLLTGGTWPDGQPCEALPRGEKLLWIDTNNELPAFHERLRCWNTPSDNIIQPYHPDRKFNLHDWDAFAWLSNAIEEFKPPLIVIDQLSLVKRA